MPAIWCIGKHILMTCNNMKNVNTVLCVHWFSTADCDSYKRQTAPLVREGYPHGQNYSCQTVTNLAGWLTDWLSVATWIGLSKCLKLALSQGPNTVHIDFTWGWQRIQFPKCFLVPTISDDRRRPKFQPFLIFYTVNEETKYLHAGFEVLMTVPMGSSEEVRRFRGVLRFQLH
jgi:hypothetical protein